jgi:hypothetical protein
MHLFEFLEEKNAAECLKMSLPSGFSIIPIDFRQVLVD